MMGNKTEITTLAVGLALGKVALYLLTWSRAPLSTSRRRAT
jgi:hypothetical protein